MNDVAVREVEPSELPAAVQAEAIRRLRRPDADRWLAQVGQVRHCNHPVRLVGHCDTIDPTTGEILASYTSRSEPDGVTYVRCGNRRRAVCPSCSHEYQGDVWHVIMAGAAGGMKNVPATVAAHHSSSPPSPPPRSGPSTRRRNRAGPGPGAAGPAAAKAGRCAGTAGPPGAWPSTITRTMWSASRCVW